MAEQTYFNRFQNFRPNSQATLNENFKQLAISKGWQQNSTRYRKERKDYMNALVDDYIESIDRGGAPDKLAGLQGLCGDLNVSPIPTSNTQCKRQLGMKHVCIIDLIDSRRRRTRVDTFTNHHDLQEHIKTQKHFFPKDDAKGKADGLLKVLLRRM